MREIDAYDRQLLCLLQTDALRTAEDLATDVALSPSAITRRVRRLRADGIIIADVAVVSESVGLFMTAIIDVQLDRHDLVGIDALLGRLAANPCIPVIMEVTGSFDLTLVVTVADMDAFNALADRLLASDPAIRRYETRVVKRRRKFSTALPL